MKNKAGIIFGIVLIWTLFFIIGIFKLDPDFGFHYRWGRDLLRNGWVWHDQYSYTIPNWPEVRHDWLTNVWMAIGFDAGGMALLSGIFASMILITIWIAVRGRKLETMVMPILLTLATWYPRAGVRPQVQDWLLSVILLRWMDGGKKIWLIPLLFLLWINLHGGFVMGLVLLGAWIVGRSWELKRVWWKGIMIFLVSLLCSGANPYGFRVWEEVWLTLSDTNLRSSIIEWLPFYYSLEISWWLLAGLAAALIYIFRKRFSVWKIIICSGLFVSALGSSRNAALFSVAALVYLPELSEMFETDITNTIEKKKRASKIWALLIGISMAVLGLTLVIRWPRNWNSTTGGEYPDQAIKFLKTYKYDGNLFSTYGWGGYLIWHYPEKKVFVDGRMPSWRNKSDWPFKDYAQIVSSGKLEPYFGKYNVEVVMWVAPPKQKETGVKAAFHKWLNSYGMYVDQEDNFLKAIQKAGWKKIYEDDTAVIYIK